MILSLGYTFKNGIIGIADFCFLSLSLNFIKLLSKKFSLKLYESTYFSAAIKNRVLAVLGGDELIWYLRMTTFYFN